MEIRAERDGDHDAVRTVHERAFGDEGTVAAGLADALRAADLPPAGLRPRRPAGGTASRKPSLRIPDAAFQVVRLPAYEEWMTGTLVYPSIFRELDCVGLRDPDARGRRRVSPGRRPGLTCWGD